MKDIFAAVRSFIEEHEMIGEDKSILAAVSGGADSLCMMVMLDEYCKEKGIRLGVGHINHGFRKEAADEALYVSQLCRERNIPFYLKEISPGECPPKEEAARNYRYRLLNEIADEKGFEKIALAHNANDRAETMLFNLFRGSGLRGMGSIRPVRDRYIRPVLCLKRREIEGYLEEKNINFCTDATNLEDNYSRNKIRHHILPLSEEINVASIDHMSETAEYMDELEKYLSAQVEKEYSRVVTQTEGCRRFDISAFAELERIIRREIIRVSLTELTPHLKDITVRHIEDIDGLAFRDGNAQIHLPYGIKAYREYDRLVITNEESGYVNTEQEINLSVLDETVILSLGGDRKLMIKKLDRSDFGEDIVRFIPRNKYTKWFDYDKISTILCVRSRREGDSLIIDGQGHKKSLSRLFIESKIPERERSKVPVLVSGQDVIWAVGCRDSYAYRIDENTDNILEITLEE